MRARPESLDALSRTTWALKAAGVGVKASGNNWSRRYRAPGRLDVLAMVPDDSRHPVTVVMRSDRGVAEADPDRPEAITAAYLTVSNPPARTKKGNP